jgi:hypothetical protein
MTPLATSEGQDGRMPDFEARANSFTKQLVFHTHSSVISVPLWWPLYIHPLSAIICFIRKQTTNNSMKLNVSHIFIFLPGKTHASIYISNRWASSSRWIRRLSSFSMLYLGPRQNFGSTSPLLSRYTSRQITERMCIRRTTERRCRNPDSDRGRARRMYSTTHPLTIP